MMGSISAWSFETILFTQDPSGKWCVDDTKFSMQAAHGLWISNAKSEKGRSGKKSPGWRGMFGARGSRRSIEEGSRGTGWKRKSTTDSDFCKKMRMSNALSQTTCATDREMTIVGRRKTHTRSDVLRAVELQRQRVKLAEMKFLFCWKEGKRMMEPVHCERLHDSCHTLEWGGVDHQWLELPFKDVLVKGLLDSDPIKTQVDELLVDMEDYVDSLNDYHHV
jgi:hypothetical protein